MKLRHILLHVLFLTFPFQFVFSQTNWLDNFNDSNFTANPAWLGNAANFTINGQKQIQLDAPAIAANSFLYTTSKTSLNATWEFWVKLDFNPSTSNYAQVFFMSSTTSVASTEGYFLQIGGSTNDRVSLYKKVNGQNTLLAASADGLVGKNTNAIKLKVLRDSSYNFSLLADTVGASGFFVFATANDSTLKNSNYFLLNCIYTSTRSDKFSFDDFVVSGDKYTDTQKPKLTAAQFINASNIELTFSEAIDSVSAKKPGNYSTTANVLSAVSWSKTTPKRIVLNYQNNYTNGQNVLLYVESVEDLAGNEMKDTTVNLTYYHAIYRDIVINEILADPTPQVDLPDIEYVEIYNNSGYPISLAGWKFVNDDDTLALLSEILNADSYLLLLSNVDASDLDSLPNIRLQTSSSWLKNDGESLLLLDENDKIIDAFGYSISLFGNSAKSAGGWSLEQIESTLPCSNNLNWAASAENLGGTPARKNNPERDSETLETRFLHAIWTDKNNVVLNFNHAISPQHLPAITSNLDIDSVLFLEANPTELTVKFNAEITNAPCAIFIKGSAGCSGNIVADTLTFSLPQAPNIGDVALNELLFNPKSTGVDFIELWNISDKTVFLKDLRMANLNEDNSIKEQFIITEDNILFPPKSYLFLSTSPVAVCASNTCASAKHFLELSKMPSMPDDEGHVAITDKSTTVFEAVNYQTTWHHELISNVEGVSLERINPALPSDKQSSWHSAASTVNYATPGFQNSQFATTANGEQNFWVNTSTLSPNNDGYNDILILGYEVPQSSTINVRVFGMNGVQIATIANNLLAAPSGEITWDGSTDSGIAPTGIFIILAEWFTPDGASGKHKITIAISR